MRVRSQLQKGVLIGAVLLVAFWLVSLIWGLVGKAQIAIVQARNVKSQYAALEMRKTSLEADIAVLSTARGKDAAIRTSFGVARAGEEVIVVVPPATATPATATPWWKKWLSWF